jgi:hypothetical protein
MVIDDGWGPNHTAGPWSRGNAQFSDKADVASDKRSWLALQSPNAQRDSAREQRGNGVPRGCQCSPLFDNVTLMETILVRSASERSRRASLLAFSLVTAAPLLGAQAPGEPATTKPIVPAWAQPGSATHVQVPPPSDFHRPSRNFNTPIGVFEGQSDIGSAIVPGSASYDDSSRQYTINSAGYNVWYSRDEFRFLWKEMSGDVSLAADVAFPNPKGYGDRKAVLILRQNLDDDSKEAMAGQHGVGMIHLAQRSEKGANIKDMQYRFGGLLAGVSAKRIGIEKHGDSIALFISLEGEPMHQFGPPTSVHFDEPFYVGLGFCSHLPDTSDTAVFSNVVIENSAGKVR